MTDQAAPNPGRELTATLIVSAYSSRCGRCRRGTRMTPTHHVQVTGYGTEPGPGCGARFTAITTGQLGSATQLVALVQLRPDLPTIIPVWMTIPDSPATADAERLLYAAFDNFRAAINRWKDAGSDDPDLHRIGEQRWEEAFAAAEEFDDAIARLRHETES